MWASRREAPKKLDALQLTIGDIVSPLWTGVILVAAYPQRVSRSGL